MFSKTSSDASVSPDKMTFTESIRTIWWYWDFVPNVSTFTMTIEGQIETDTNSQTPYSDAFWYPRGSNYLDHRLSGYQIY